MPHPSAPSSTLGLALCLGLAALGLTASPAARADDPASLRDWAQKTVAANAAKAIPAPDFGAGRAWLNVSRPLTREKDLRGKVLVMDFWCYCCINCMHVLPDLEFLEQKFERMPVAIVGVHSAKFANEKDAEHVREAVVRYEIHHPVVVDDDFGIWRSYGAKGWPHFVVVSPTGHVLAALGGEGHRAELDALIEAALALYAKRSPSVLDAAPLPIRLERGTRPAGALAYPGKLAADEAHDRLYVSDSNHHRILELRLDGTFLRAFGSGTPGRVDGPAATARFQRPQGLALRGGGLFVADTENHSIRRIGLEDGVVTTVAGTGDQGSERADDHPALEVALSSPWDLCFVGDTLYVSMAGTHQLWRMDLAKGRISAWAGDGSERKLDGPTLEAAAFAQPSGLATDGTWLYVADSESSSVRRVRLPDGPVETLAGANDESRDLFDFGRKDGVGHAAKFQHPLGVAVAKGRLYVADTYNHAIRAIDLATGQVTTPWGTGAPGSADAPAAFYEPSGLAVAGSRLLVADTNNHRLRSIDLASGKVTTLGTSGIPISTPGAREGGTSWPELPDTERRVQAAVEVRGGAKLRVVVRVALPAGWHLTEDAPSALRVDGVGAAAERKIEGLETTVALATPLPATEATATLRVRLLYYVCQDAGTCRVRSLDVTVPLRSSDKGAEAVAVDDTFAP